MITDEEKDAAMEARMDTATDPRWPLATPPGQRGKSMEERQAEAIAEIEAARVKLTAMALNDTKALAKVVGLLETMSKSGRSAAINWLTEFYYPDGY